MRSVGKSISGATLEKLFFHIGLIEMLSYWKAACSPEIVVRAGTVNHEQIQWWMDLIERGMGEFFYVNQIDFWAADFVRIVAEPDEEKNQQQVPRVARDDSKGVRGGDGGAGVRQTDKTGNTNDESTGLVLTSGGKDSVVTLELLRQAGRNFDCLFLNPAEAAMAVARQAGCSRERIIQRVIDPRLQELNAAGYLNGHTPFSALLAFLGVTAAYLYGNSTVIVSNERSAEEATAQFHGREVNHQYTKNLRFEGAFREYAKRYLTPDVDYFSLLRPVYELQIARMFSRHPEYLTLFKSCNRGMKTNSWCGRCPKCLFVYTALYPFLSREQMLAIFGEDLFAWQGSLTVLQALLGLDRDKPFECVGTREETLVAIYLCAEKYKEQRVPLPDSLREIGKTVLASQRDLPERSRLVLGAWSDQNYLPPDLAERVRRISQ